MSTPRIEPTNSQTQDAHSHVLAAVLAPIRDLNENWKFDLSKHLETYLRELCDPETAFGSVNFVEAALLIQRSVGIYGKKVEYLWQLLLEVLQTFKKKGLPGEKQTDRKKRSDNISELLQDFGEISVNIDKKKWKGKQDPVKLDPPFYSELEYNCPREKKLSLFDHALEPLGDKLDFRLNYPISNGCMLEEELSHKGDALVLPSEFEEIGALGEAHNSEAVVNSEDIPDDGENGADLDPDELCNPPEETEEESDTRVNPHSAENRENIADVKDDLGANVVLGTWDSVFDTIADKPVKQQERYKLPCDAESERRGDGKEDDEISVLVTDNIAKTFTVNADKSKFQVDFIKETRKKNRENRRADEIEEYRKILASDFPGDFLGFEDYEGSSDEDEGFLGYPDPNDAHDDHDDAPAEDGNAQEENAEANTENNDFPLPSISVPTASDDWGQVYQTILQEKMQSAQVGQQDAQAALAARVAEWHESIRQKLKSAEERGSMDIHEYGTKILNTFPKGTAKTTIDFAKVIKDEEEVEISRYFLASLMLANTYNVEITKSNDSELAMNCMELTLLKHVRHHETLENYHAPSQVSGRERRGST